MCRMRSTRRRTLLSEECHPLKVRVNVATVLINVCARVCVHVCIYFTLNIMISSAHTCVGSPRRHGARFAGIRAASV